MTDTPEPDMTAAEGAWDDPVCPYLGAEIRCAKGGPICALLTEGHPLHGANAHRAEGWWSVAGGANGPPDVPRPGVCVSPERVGKPARGRHHPWPALNGLAANCRRKPPQRCRRASPAARGWKFL
jgi:hypothetical protein